jgi:hypothetical protein
MKATTFRTRVRPWSAVAALLLIAMAVIHAVEVPHYLDEHPAVGGLFVADSAAAIVLAVAVLRGRRGAWALSALLAAATAATYVLSRSVGLPGYRDDSWVEPLGGVPMGPLSLAVEGLVVFVALIVLTAGRAVFERSRAARPTGGLRPAANRSRR